MINFFVPESIPNFSSYYENYIAKAKQLFGKIPVKSEYVVKYFPMFTICEELIDLIWKIEQPNNIEPVKNVVNIFEIGNIILEHILKQPNWLEETNVENQEALAFLLLFYASKTFNTMQTLRNEIPYYESVKAEMKANMSQTILNRAEIAFHEYMEKCELVCDLALVNNAWLLKYKKILMQRLFDYELVYNHSIYFPQTLNRLIQMKNVISAKFDFPYYGMLIANENSPYGYTLDPKSFKKVLKVIDKIVSNQQQRTQVVYHLAGQPRYHALALDIQYDNSKNQLQIICYDSTKHALQFAFLKKLTAELVSKNIPYAIIACQGDTQKDEFKCMEMAFIAGSFLSKLQFSKLMQMNKINTPSAFTLVGRQFEPEDLPNVHWLDVTAFGTKAVLMSQSINLITQGMKALGITSSTAVTNLIDKYEINRDQREYYPEYKDKIFQAKLAGTPFAGLSTEKILQRARTESTAQALRRAAAGLLPCRELEFLLEQMKLGTLKNEIDEPDSGETEYTPLHVALDKGKVKQSCLLLNYGAKTDIPSKKNGTAKDLFLNKPKLHHNKYLSSKLKK